MHGDNYMFINGFNINNFSYIIITGGLGYFNDIQNLTMPFSGSVIITKET